MEAVACGDHHMMFNSVLIEVKTPQRPIWISECPRAFRKFKDVYRQPVDTFADVIGVVVYASEIQDRGDFRRRPNRHVVIMNQRKNFIIIHVNDPHLQRHIWEWRRAAYQFKTLAALHVKISTMQGGVTTTDYSQIIFSPICSDAYDLKDLSKRIRAERKQITKTARALTLDIINK
ncbi:uncharacterized protein [Setaria viridis]|nr:uncharacterized protein LOC117860783 isoform X2 [Setaria viridis]XP_034600054.1 uncharacterized protein LOC117860783 isoform X2 [Setaria viridis]